MKPQMNSIGQDGTCSLWVHLIITNKPVIDRVGGAKLHEIANSAGFGPYAI